MSGFEITMLVCFGSSWPFSIYRVWRTKCAAGKSIVFLALILIGYFAGVLHKVCYSPDPVVALYALNAAMVGTDLALSIRYRPAAIPAPARSENQA